jgi:hypothetical protein
MWHICWKPTHVARQWPNKRDPARALTSRNSRRTVGSGVFCAVRLDGCVTLQYSSCKKRLFCWVHAEALLRGPTGQANYTRVEAGSNTSTVTLRVVGGDEMGSLKSETVWSRVPRDSDPRKTALTRASSKYKRPTLPLVREGTPQKQDRNCQTIINIWSWAPDGARHQDLLTDWPSVAMWLWLWLWSEPVKPVWRLVRIFPP